MKLIARNDLSVVFLASIRGLSGPGSKLFRPVGSSHLGAIQTAPCGLLSFYLSYYIVGVSVKKRERERAQTVTHCWCSVDDNHKSTRDCKVPHLMHGVCNANFSYRRR